ncbi:hypothetical protein JSQ81_05200 [Sporosarcina sp. Marseille-Q4063]|uniref:hypothetical protein n=1 Tax=Sporosarcina sp. Marseille-Q4063 TaxID=2810514 RepID=UPI001BAF7BF5|nr:hypothetical protein [Sporosarcina sp. Marseille-Q4063]QUW22973.1 hypothetical protein JSQ81_05200 [Sporosarcina sp. Marseille-Q4063]
MRFDDIIAFTILFLFLIGSIMIMVNVFKSRPLKIFNGTKYLGITKVSLSFKVFDTYFVRNYWIRPNVTYEVFYKLKTEEGKLTMSLDNQLFEETTTSVEGSVLMTFDKLKPVVKLVGENAINGHAEVKLIKHQ